MSEKANTIISELDSFKTEFSIISYENIIKTNKDFQSVSSAIDEDYKTQELAC